MLVLLVVVVVLVESAVVAVVVVRMSVMLFVGLLEVGRFVSNKLSDPGHCQTNPGGGQPANPKGV